MKKCCISVQLISAVLLSGCATDNKPEQTTAGTSAPAAISQDAQTSASGTFADTASEVTSVSSPLVITEVKEDELYSLLVRSYQVPTCAEASAMFGEIKSFDYSSDDLNAVLGMLLAGNNICWSACNVFGGEDNFAHTREEYDFFELIYPREYADELGDNYAFMEEDGIIEFMPGSPDVDVDDTCTENYFFITDSDDDEISFVYFISQKGLVSMSDDYDRDKAYYDAYRFGAAKEDGKWKLSCAVYGDPDAGYIGRVECDYKQLLDDRFAPGDNTVPDALYGTWKDSAGGKILTLDADALSSVKIYNVIENSAKTVMVCVNEDGKLCRYAVYPDDPDTMFCYDEYIYQEYDYCEPVQTFVRS